MSSTSRRKLEIHILWFRFGIENDMLLGRFFCDILFFLSVSCSYFTTLFEFSYLHFIITHTYNTKGSTSRTAAGSKILTLSQTNNMCCIVDSLLLALLPPPLLLLLQPLLPPLLPPPPTPPLLLLIH